jgi:hypothetical protein
MTARQTTLEACIEGGYACRNQPSVRDRVGAYGSGEGMVELAVSEECFKVIAGNSRHGLCPLKTYFRFIFAILDRMDSGMQAPWGGLRAEG